MNIIVSIIGILLILAIAGVTYMLMIAEGEEQENELPSSKTGASISKNKGLSS